MDKYKKRILIDLDGVLNEYGNSPYDENYIPGIKKDAVDFLKKLNEIAELYLFTSRNLLLSSKWLIANNIDMYFKDITNMKIPANIYIDDRCICFNGDFNSTYDEIVKFKVYWK